MQRETMHATHTHGRTVFATTVVIGALLAMSAALAGTTAAASSTISVDDSGGADYTTIQDAVDNASPGDTIEVKPGTYTEQVDVDKGVTIESTAGPEQTTIRKAGGGAVIRSTSTLSDLTIEGFTINGSDGTFGIYLTNQGNHENVTLRNNVVSGGGQFISAALLWDLDGTVRITNNEFSADYDGINIQGDPATEQPTDLVVTGNTFSGLGDNGAEFNTIRDLTFEDNVVEDYATIDDDRAAGLEIAEDGSVSGAVRVKRNTITEGAEGSNAIGLYDGGEAENRTVTIAANQEIDGAAVDLRHPGNGRFLGTQFLASTEIETTDPGLPTDLTLSNPSGDALAVTVTTSGPVTGLTVELSNAPEEGDERLTLEGDTDGTSADDLTLASSANGTYTYTATVTGTAAGKGATTYRATLASVNGNAAEEISGRILPPSKTVPIKNGGSGPGKKK